MRKLLFSLFIVPAILLAQEPAGYYNGTTGLTGYALKTKLRDIISAKNVNWHYSDLQNIYNQTDIDKFYDYDATNTSYLLDIYSNNPTGTTAYHYTSAQMIGSSNAEGLGWNREHQMPQSTFNSNYPMYSDLFFVIPTDARINQLRSNYPYGISSTTPSYVYYTFTNGSKIGRNNTPNSAYTGRVYEPHPEFKGDIARALLYFVVRYEGKLGSFNFYNGTSPANDRSPLDGTEEKAFEDWYISLLLQWHNEDQVSPREIARNNSVFAVQKNRNPFIDHPEWVNMIWGQTPSTVAPSTISDLNVTQTSAYFVNLSWTPSTGNGILGYKVYQNGTFIGYTKTNSFIADRLSPSTPYNFTVKAYNDNYMESAESNVVSVTTLDTDIYAKDLMITKYIEGTANNKALEITNKTGHAVDLTKYRLSIQYYSGTNYYFPAPYELEGVVENNSTFVVLNPKANLSCITNDQARFVTAAPQLTFDGSNYIELRNSSTTVDAVGTLAVNNFATLGNTSLYRNATVTQPSSTFVFEEWTKYPNDYCTGLGMLSASDVSVYADNNFTVYPNPSVGNIVYIKGKNLEKVQTVSILDISGKIVERLTAPFKNDNSLNVQKLTSGVYILQLDDKAVKFIKN
ncbi:endonuclease [Chryseobacterium suipulveris]|uniref:Endonuclease n=1 Tax=Chryseobacterium suipulveris TaxID=2929800 RepID=A0ABY4BV84_9FLAO|nr:endonuclease [Chryseobacterium suipulveris]UOE42092.1 endonuclease [Chryseobacterium suipulveris]